MIRAMAAGWYKVIQDDSNQLHAADSSIRIIQLQGLSWHF